jgi:septal ring factor EnvC (AmiA/AmiB activator)
VVPAAGKSPAAAAANKRMNPLKQQQIEKQIAALEAQIEAAEAAIAHLDAQLSQFSSAAESQRLAAAAAKERARLEELMAQWETLSEQLN